MTKKTFAEAFADGLASVLREEPNLTILGGGLLGHGPTRIHEKKLLEEFGKRFVDPPSSESAMTSFGVGAAMTGHRMLVHFGTAGFSLEAWNQLAHEGALARYQSGGQITVPLTFHGYHGMRFAGAPQHSCSPQAMLANCPGIEVVLPSTPADVKGLLRTALKSDNPTFVFNHTKLQQLEGEVPDENYEIPFGKADVKREGRDVTVVAMSHCVHVALEAAEVLAGEGIEIEVVDPRTVVPLDVDGICRSVHKTGRLVTVDETPQTCSLGSEIGAAVAENAFHALKAPIGRVNRTGVPAPFSPTLEYEVLPNKDKIVSAVRRVMGCFVLLGALLTGTGGTAAADLTANEKFLAELGKLPLDQREQKLIEGAKKEGKVTLFTGNRGKAADDAMKLFNDAYPFLKLSYTSNSSPIVTELLITETAAGKHLTDGMSGNTPNFLPLLEKNIAARNPSPVLDLIPARYAGFKDPEARFIPYYTTGHAIGFNPTMMKPEEYPKSYQDLCHPRFKGQNSFEPPEAQFLIGLYEMYGHDEQKVQDWLKCIGENEPIIMKGHTTRLMLLLAGDHAVSPDLLDYNGVSLNLKNPKKAPFQIVYEAPIMVNATACLVNNNATNVNAAALFADFCLSDQNQAALYEQMRGTMKGKHPFLPDNAILIPYAWVDPAVEERLIGYWNKYVGTRKY
jgi:pyruvate/2-oxoglutarate/acetoin dehydrogenase E1 component/ABC-type Fe3+ transport system substrate-binding protein